MREAVEMIVKGLVDYTEAGLCCTPSVCRSSSDRKAGRSVDVREIDRNGVTLIEIRVAPEDMGKVIGRQGRTVRSLRSLAHAVGLKRKHRFVLEIVE